MIDAQTVMDERTINRLFWEILRWITELIDQRDSGEIDDWYFANEITQCWQTEGLLTRGNTGGAVELYRAWEGEE
mgnify:CR=1 FL=1|jgi:hypothetical protein|tara:strand:+ start:582 stop:806 length:225 start_codon:yes stop_codon:yes gene_type:complete